MEEHHHIEAAYQLCDRALARERRSNDSPFVGHAHGVAKIVAQEFCLPPSAVCAVLLHEATRKHPELLIEVKRCFAPEVYSMVLGLNRISTINPNDTRLQAENYRKLIVAYSTDPVVVLIKLADRLEVMRSLSFFPKSQQLRKATETLMLYAPLAHQLGLYSLKSELEDLSFKYSEPDDFKKITSKLKATVGEREQALASFVAPIEAELKRTGYAYELKSRTKTAYSIWKKMQAQQVAFEGVYDILAIRIILDTPPDKTEEDKRCWQVYSIVTNLFTPDTNRLRDWITKPKPNGYESLHGTVSDERGRVVEVQIRSRRMDAMAESGMAAHWSYKGLKRNEFIQEWLDRLKGLLQSDLSPDSETIQFFSQFKINEVFVFTPVGDLRRLPAGATVLDFAFDIHSNLGLRCSGAKIQNRVVSIREKLQTGDVVEIITSKNQRPSADWLHIVTINKAKSKIRQKLREYEGKKELLGRELLERRMKNWKMELNEEVVSQLLRHFKLKNINDLYAALGQDEIAIDKIKELLERPRQEPEHKLREEVSHPSKSNPNGDYLVIDPKLGQLSYKLAKCCNPEQGDEVFGFVTAKEGIKLHRTSCPNAQRLYDKYHYRIIPVQWKTRGSPALGQG
ncbi:MAG: RelA/SpoT family protein [Bacteroidales bacterium]|nr:RelA/SpoT family protein [Bacteroidales bacterium]MCL2738795.1 RelA/SpoT family protein [Bacteroidales bacterium]